MRELKLVVIDGLPAETVIMVQPPIVGNGCKDDKHCAAHGSGRYFCCKCGAAFEFKQEVA